MVATGGPHRAHSDDPMPEIALLAARPWSQVELLGHRRLADAIAAAGDDAVARHPAVLLHYARSCEPGLRFGLRSAALDRLTQLLDRGRRPDAAALQLEVVAERAIDEARAARLDPAETLALQVLDATGQPTEPARRPAHGDPFVAAARATETLGRVLAWRGDKFSSQLAGQRLLDAAARYRWLGSTEWEGGVGIWLGNAVRYQWGDLAGAEEAMVRGFAVLAPNSPRRAVLLTFFAEVLLTRGRMSEFDAVLDEAAALAAAQDDRTAVSYIAWSRARACSVSGDATGTVRALREAESYRSDWWDITSGTMFLADAAELVDRVGDHAAADAYLARAVERDPDDEFVAQATAALMARRGDPEEALQLLRRLAHAPWLEKRLVWRHTLLASYATVRARRPRAGALAARALAEAVEVGGLDVATTGEAQLVRTLAPLAAAAGSQAAVSLIAPTHGLIVRLLGEVRVTRHDETLSLPVGASGAMVRLLALHPSGLDAEQVMDALWPEADADTGRRRLRDARFRLHARCGELVQRRGSRLALVEGWVDLVAFRAAADRAASAGSERTAAVAAALALWTGEPLPGDTYADWAITARDQLHRRYLQLLDLGIADAEERDSLDEACALLEEAVETEPDEEHRFLRLADHHLALGRPDAARSVLKRAVRAAAHLDERPSAQVLSRLEALREAGPAPRPTATR